MIKELIFNFFPSLLKPNNEKVPLFNFYEIDEDSAKHVI